MEICIEHELKNLLINMFHYISKFLTDGSENIEWKNMLCEFLTLDELYINMENSLKNLTFITKKDIFEKNEITHEFFNELFVKFYENDIIKRQIVDNFNKIIFYIKKNQKHLPKNTLAYINIIKDTIIINVSEKLKCYYNYLIICYKQLDKISCNGELVIFGHATSTMNHIKEIDEFYSEIKMQNDILLLIKMEEVIDELKHKSEHMFQHLNVFIKILEFNLTKNINNIEYYKNFGNEYKKKIDLLNTYLKKRIELFDCD